MDLGSVAGYGQGLLTTAKGFPLFNISLWFLVALFSLELLHRFTGPRLRSSRPWSSRRRYFTAFGYLINLDIVFFPERNYWLLNEVPVLYAFYLTGILLRRRVFMESPASQSPSRHPTAPGCARIALPVSVPHFNQRSRNNSST